MVSTLVGNDTETHIPYYAEQSAILNIDYDTGAESGGGGLVPRGAAPGGGGATVGRGWGLPREGEHPQRGEPGGEH